MKPLSILVADDVESTRDVITHCLRSRGHEVTCASGGRIAIDLIHRTRFDIVITDVLMPDVDGMEVIMAVRTSGRGTRVIVMSGGGDYFGPSELLSLAATLGAEVRLPKPFSKAQLLEAVDRVSGTDFPFEGAA